MATRVITSVRERSAVVFKSYVQHPVPRREAREKPVWEPNTAPMDGWSTSRKDYGPKEGTKQQSYKPEAVAFRSTQPAVAPTNSNHYPTSMQRSSRVL